MPMPTEGGTPPPDQPKETREELLKELEEIKSFLEKWGPLYLKLEDKKDEALKDTKYWTGNMPEDGKREPVDQDAFMVEFYKSFTEARNIDSIRDEYIRKINRKAEIEQKLMDMAEGN